MMSEVSVYCPACRTGLSDRDRTCPKCGLPFAAARWFADQEALEDWKKKVEAKKKEFAFDTTTLRGKRLMAMSSRYVSFLRPDNDELVMLDRYGNQSVYGQCAGTFMSESARTVVFRDGTVNRAANDMLPDMNVDRMTDIGWVCEMNDTVALVSRTGRVLLRGICPFADEVAKLENIRMVSGGNGFLCALNRLGKVQMVGADPLGLKGTVSGWTDIIAVASAGEHIVAVDSKHHVHACGRIGGTELKIQTGEKIVDCVTNERFVFLLTEKGRILVEGGDTTAYGNDIRTKVPKWTEIVAVACGRNCVGAIDRDGNLLTAGQVVYGDVSATKDAIRAAVLAIREK